MEIVHMFTKTNSVYLNQFKQIFSSTLLGNNSLKNILFDTGFLKVHECFTFMYYYIILQSTSAVNSKTHL